MNARTWYRNGWRCDRRRAYIVKKANIVDLTPEVTHPDLRGQTVVITGGAKGIGLATAQAFTRQGARVALLDMDAAALDDAVLAPRTVQGVEHDVGLGDDQSGRDVSAGVDAGDLGAQTLQGRGARFARDQADLSFGRKAAHQDSDVTTF